MSKTDLIAVVSTLLLFLVVSPSMAEIKTLTITSDTRPRIFFQNFGFTHTGHVSIAVSAVSVVTPISSEPDPSRLGFFLLSNESFLQVLSEIQQNPNFCVLDSHYITRLLSFRDLSPPPSASANHNYPVTIPDKYYLFFANCAPETSVTMSIRTELYNLDGHGSRNYLSSTDSNTPFLSLLFLYFIAYILFLAFWLYICHISKLSFNRIHLSMAMLLLATAFSFVCVAVGNHYVKVTGTSHGWDVLFFVFDLSRVVLFFTVIVLVGTRWTFLHPLMPERGKKTLLVVIPLQVVANIVWFYINETGPYIKYWVTWNHVMLLLGLLSYCPLLFLFVRALRSFREEAKDDAINLYKFNVIKWFYLAVIGFFTLFRFVIFALEFVIAGEYQWVSNLVQHTAALVFLIQMFYVFNLLDKDQYCVIADED